VYYDELLWPPRLWSVKTRMHSLAEGSGVGTVSIRKDCNICACVDVNMRS
jgi:hypothetical protein